MQGYKFAENCQNMTIKYRKRNASWKNLKKLKNNFKNVLTNVVVWNIMNLQQRKKINIDELNGGPVQIQKKARYRPPKY